ncbi:unnamed protein product [Jaminaea pallidilutea]
MPPAAEGQMVQDGSNDRKQSARSKGPAVQPSPSNKLKKLVDFAHSLLLTQRFFVPFAVAVFALDALFTLVIIRKVAYTEIDYSTYMQQVAHFLKGQRDYRSIQGDTGPCVYPAGHLYAYTFFYWLTDAGKDLRTGQYAFGLLYLTCQAAVLEVYRKAGAPSMLLFMLPISKRLHSIYVLRLFNDGVAMTVMWIALAFVAHRKISAAVVLTSIALSIKMNILLFVPGLAIVVYRERGLLRGLVDASLLVTVQTLMSLPFLLSDHPRVYIAQAFDLSRQFLFKWTVNLRFLGEDLFLHPTVGRGLLLLHAALLTLFGLTRWTRLNVEGLEWIRRTCRNGDRKEMTPRIAVLILLTSNLIGISCARSLHYQFYSWYAQSVPLLTWESRLPIALKLPLPFIIEYVWNVFPSTSASSAMLCAANATLVVGLYGAQWAPSMQERRWGEAGGQNVWTKRTGTAREEQEWIESSAALKRGNDPRNRRPFVRERG